MISIGTYQIDLSNPFVVAGLLGLALLIWLILLVRRSSKEATKIAEKTLPLGDQIKILGENIKVLNEGQHQLAGGLQQVGQLQNASQSQMMKIMEQRLEDVQRNMGTSLQGNASQTAKSLGALQQRLVTIDKAQSNIEKLSGNVLTLQEILSNKQTRGSFGEIQLQDIVKKALPPDSYAFQVTLTNGTRADCLIDLPNPPGPIAIDSKFPLEAYEALQNAESDAELKAAAARMRKDLRRHIQAISEKYIIEGETADGALLFLPSEAVYAELHATFADIVREGFDARVWIVSPTTCMATLNTMRAIVKDARMRKQAGAIRSELSLLNKDVERLLKRVGNLETHFNQASRDIEEITISAEKTGKRARRLDAFDFESLEAEKSSENVVPLSDERSKKTSH